MQTYGKYCGGNVFEFYLWKMCKIQIYIIVKLKLTAFFLLIYGFSCAQQSNVSPETITLQLTISERLTAFPFDKIEVTDFRPDTSKIGYLKKKKKDIRLVTANSLAANLTQILNAAVPVKAATASEQSVWLVIKKFWLKVPTHADWQRKSGVDDRKLKSLWGWHIKLEAYANYGGLYTPLFRVDSLYGFDEFDERKTIEMDALGDCLRRLQRINTDNLKAAKTKLTQNAVDSFNQLAFLKPVLIEKTMSKGVFLTFSDFVNQRTVYSAFDIEKGKEIDNLYVRREGQKELLTNFWGYCDGKNYYIRCNRNFYQLYQQGNTFEFTGHSVLAMSGGRSAALPPGTYHSTSDLGAGIANGLLTNMITGAVFNRDEFRHFQLNMETGEIY